MGPKAQSPQISGRRSNPPPNENKNLKHWSVAGSQAQGRRSLRKCPPTACGALWTTTPPDQ